MLAIALVVVGLVGGGRLLGDSDPESGPPGDEESGDGGSEDSSNTAATRGSTTTRPSTTTEPPPVAPIFGEPVGGALMVLRSGVWERVDLATGTVTIVGSPLTVGLDRYSAGASVPISGGIATPVDDGEVHFYPLVGTSDEPEHVVLGSGEQVLSAGPDRLWIVGAPDDSDDPFPDLEVRLVDVSGRVFASFQSPLRDLVAATPNEVLAARGGKVYAIGENGVRLVAAGSLTGTMGGAPLITMCDESARCSLWRYPNDGSAPRELFQVTEPDGYLEVVEGPDGRTAIIEKQYWDSGGPRLRLFAPDGTELGVVEPAAGEWVDRPQFLPGDLGLVAEASDRLRWIHEVAGSWRVDDIEAPEFPDSVLLVTP